MKSIYLYVPDGDAMTVNSVVIWLSVGTSQREQTRLALLENYAIDCGGFLRIRDDDSDFWLDQHARRLFPDSNTPRLHFISAPLSICEAYRMTIDGTLENYARNYTRPIQFLNTLLQLDANFMRNHSQKPCITSCPRGKRKYLSHGVGHYFFYVTLPFTLLIVGGLIDRLGELIINFLF